MKKPEQYKKKLKSKLKDTELSEEAFGELEQELLWIWKKYGMTKTQSISEYSQCSKLFKKF